jgi:hypothetical protein
VTSIPGIHDERFFVEFRIGETFEGEPLRATWAQFSFFSIAWLEQSKAKAKTTERESCNL